MIAIVVAASLGVALEYLPLIQRNERAQLAVYREEARLAALSNELEELRAELTTYRNDRDALKRRVEIILREEFRYAREDEVIFRFADE